MRRGWTACVLIPIGQYLSLDPGVVGMTAGRTSKRSTLLGIARVWCLVSTISYSTGDHNKAVGTDILAVETEARPVSDGRMSRVGE